MEGKIEVICDCIYCGSDNVQASDANMGYCGDLWHVICFDCLAAGPEAGSKERAIAEWNKPHIAINQRIQELEAAIQRHEAAISMGECNPSDEDKKLWSVIDKE